MRKLILAITVAMSSAAFGQTPIQQELKDAVELCKANTVRPLSDSEGYKPGFEECPGYVARYAAAVNAAAKKNDADAKARFNDLKSKIK